MRKYRLHLAAAVLALLCAIIGCASAADDYSAEGYPQSIGYSNRMTRSTKEWHYDGPEDAEVLRITFSEETELETNCDFLYLEDANGSTRRFTGTELKGKSIELIGNSFKELKRISF